MPTRAKLLIALGLAVLASACNDSEFKGTSAKLAPTVTKYFIQDNYPGATTVARQGYAGEPQMQKFEPGEWGALDLLVVIDSSGSMKEEQTNLSTKLKPLLSQIEKSNWQIAVVTTDPAAGCQRALIKKTDADAAAKFQDAINAGIKGDGLERPILQAVNGLKATCAGAKSWVRPGSTLSVLIVTDEDNCHVDEGQGYGCQGLADKDGKYLTDYLSSVRTIGKDARVYGLFWAPGDDLAPGCKALKKADIVAGVVDSTSGKWGSICDADYTATLTAISKDIAQIVKYEFDLTQDPDNGTLTVTVDGAPWTKFENTDKHVKFTEQPPFGAKIEIAYKYGAEGDMTKEFVLEKPAVAGSITAKVNGVTVDPGKLSFDEKTKKVTFADAPAERADVSFTYKEAVPLKSEFNITSKEVDPSTLTVFVDERQLPNTAFIYNAAKATVTINPPPPEAAKIRISFKDLLK